MEGIKSMEKAFHSLFFATDKVDIVNQQHTNISIFIVEFISCSLPDRLDELIGELFRTNINHLNMPGLSQMPDRV